MNLSRATTSLAIRWSTRPSTDVDALGVNGPLGIKIQGRINHCAGCIMGGGSRGPDQLQIFFYHAVLTSKRWWAIFGEGLDVRTTKKGRHFFGKEE